MTLIREMGMVGNSTEARNALSSNGVKLDEVVITDPKMIVQVNSEKKLVQVGKKKFGYIIAN